MIKLNPSLKFNDARISKEKSSLNLVANPLILSGDKRKIVFFFSFL